MKKRRRFNPNCLLLIIGLAAGIWLGYNFANRKISELPFTPTASPFPTNKEQRSLIVVGVDQLSAPSPKLKGAWYIAYLPDMPEINLVPLYPAIREPYRSKNSELEKTFQISRSGELSPEFLTALKSVYGLAAGEPVLFDDSALIGLINLLGGVELNGRVINGKNAVESIPLPLENLDEAFTGQAMLLNGLCLRTINTKQRWQPEDMQMLIPKHLRTQFDLELALADWASLNALGSAIRCEINIPGQHNPP